MNRKIDLVPDEDFSKSGIIKYVKWDYAKNPHMVIFGGTGSGKSYLLRLLLGRIGLHIPDSELLICDYKADDDFSFLGGLRNFYRFNECMEGLDRALNVLQDRQHGNPERNFFALVFDEWASFLNNMDKKQADGAKQKLSTLLMLGRSYNIHIIISQQRLDASYFGSSRDNFSVVFGMGVLSKESVEMMFSDYKESIIRNKPRGHGSLIVGDQFKNIVVPPVYHLKKLEDVIISAVDRKPEE